MKKSLFKQKSYLYESKDTAPNSVAGSGNITTSSQNFTTTSSNALKEGDFVVNLSSNEVKMVTKMTSETTGLIESSFASNLSNVSLVKVLREDIEFVYEISVRAIADSSVDGVELLSGDVQTNRIAESAYKPQQSVLEPMIIDGATGNCRVTIAKMVSY